MNRIRILIADDHQIFREGLRLLLEAKPGFSVVGEAADGLQALELAERLRPDVMIVDVSLPGLTGIEVVRLLRLRSPQTRAIVLSSHADESYVLDALRHGAAGYVLKHFSTEDLIQAIREAIAGRHYLSPPLSALAIDAYVEKARSAGGDSYDSLTTREREILQLTAEGCSATAIAARLCISSRTAESHRANMMRKLGLHNHAGVIRYALQRGILADA
jgi:DNA-binding NarL/FixJ family response regulator